MDKHELDRQCEIILEQVRMEILEPKEALERLKEFWRKLS